MSNQLIDKWKEENKTKPVKERLEWLESYVSILLELREDDKKKFIHLREDLYKTQMRISKLEVANMPDPFTKVTK